MTTSSSESEKLHALVEARLRLVDQRYTSGRRELIAFLDQSPHPVSIGEITSALPALPRSSAYRNLVDLQSAGLVRRVSASDDFARFELDEELTEHHHHLLCISCGRVIDVTASPSFEETLTRTVATLVTSHDFVAHDHRLDILGTCASCR
jgi:Fur family transcriptional regulator, ferric uptake regulator